MTEIRFYHLTRSALEQALPELLEKTVARGWRAVVMAGSAERVEALTQHLWTYHPNRFLPHGSAKDGNAELHPVWLTHADECPNGANVLFLTDRAESAQAGNFERVCDIFDGNDPDALAAARKRWASHQSGGHMLSYWQQGDKGWVEKKG